MERNYRKDLELCARATPGKWKERETPDYSEIWAEGVRSPIALVGSNAQDVEFIIQAREALPYWLEKFQELAELLKKTQVWLSSVDVEGYHAWYSNDYIHSDTLEDEIGDLLDKFAEVFESGS